MKSGSLFRLKDLANFTIEKNKATFHSIDVDPQVPFIHGIRIYTGQQRKIPGYHQALDMVGIGVVQGLIDGMLEAIHTGVARPEKFGKRCPVIEKIGGRQIRHERPVDAAHVLTPAQYLSDKALDLLNAYFSWVVFPGLQGRRYHFHGAQHFAI